MIYPTVDPEFRDLFLRHNIDFILSELHFRFALIDDIVDKNMLFKVEEGLKRDFSLFWGICNTQYFAQLDLF